MDNSTAETIVKIWAVLAWLSALFTGLGALGLVFWGSFMGGMMGSYGYNMMGGYGLAGLGAFLGLLLLAFAVFSFFVGLGLWNHRPWARITTLVFSVLGVLSILSGNLVNAIIGGLGVWLFGFEPAVTGLFNAKPIALATAKPAAKKKR